MDHKAKSLGDRIEDLARETGASPSYVKKVRALFLKKGIPLDADGSPYQIALEEAFHRQETMRRSVSQAAESLAQIHDQLTLLGKTRAEDVAKLREIQRTLEEQHRVIQETTSLLKRNPMHAAGKAVLVRGDLDLPFVPGPKSVQ
jgi:hypothetical protein